MGCLIQMRHCCTSLVTSSHYVPLHNYFDPSLYMLTTEYYCATLSFTFLWAPANLEELIDSICSGHDTCHVHGGGRLNQVSWIYLPEKRFQLISTMERVT